MSVSDTLFDALDEFDAIREAHRPPELDVAMVVMRSVAMLIAASPDALESGVLEPIEVALRKVPVDELRAAIMLTAKLATHARTKRPGGES